jgi:putative transposase
MEVDWPRLSADITGTVDQKLLLRNESLAAENRILKAQIKDQMQLSDAEITTLAGIAHRLGRELPEEVTVSATPDTILGWYQYRIANKIHGSKARRTHGRPRIDEDL